jgi:hypothetical protein
MKNERKPASMQEVYRSLDTPSEANREKHINYLDDERTKSKASEDFNDRQKQWQEGIEEGRSNNNQSDDIY